MSRRHKLLSIGEMAKLTEASIRSLRYYEEINLLKPAHIDPNSGYRYYALDQAHLIGMIMFCNELDIPLKELPAFANADDTMDYRAFLAKGKDIATKKLKKIKQGLKLIRDLERKMDLSEAYPVGQIYTREIPKKHFHVKPCGTSIKDLDLLEIFKSFSDMPFAEGDYDDLSEFGFMCEQSLEGTMYYAFMEVPKRMANKTIPAEIYACRQSEDSQIEQIPEIFKEYLAGKGIYLAIETEVFTGKHKIDRPLNEVRVIAL